MIRRRSDRRPALLAFTTTVIVLGLGASVWAIVTYPISPVLSLTTTGGREGILLGLVFWVALGLLGSLRIERLHGHGVLTFHLPFIIAATILGGPAAGAVVGLISTFETRELREMPWYGLLSNHAGIALAAVLGGVVYLDLQRLLADVLPQDQRASQLAGLVLASLVISLVSSGIASVTMMLRDRLTTPELLRVFDSGHRTTAAGEVVLGWLLVVTYTEMGWWAASVAALLALTAWASHDAREVARRDALTGLLTRYGFDEPLQRAIERKDQGHISAVLAIDLDDFKVINDTMGHDAGDEVIRVVANRLRTNIRLTDAAVRRGGDEFSVLFTDLPDVETAGMLVDRIYRAILDPIDLERGEARVGASIGVYLLEPDGKAMSVADVHKRTDRRMYHAKRHDGGPCFTG
jgi:diguanylate cyclase (GGDEF)-like protein